jgi:hypothetical protein
MQIVLPQLRGICSRPVDGAAKGFTTIEKAEISLLYFFSAVGIVVI